MMYVFLSNFSISVGCVWLFLFKYFVLLDVGYLYYWFILLDLVYGVFINNMDGVCYDYINYYGDWEYGFQVFGGCGENGDIDVEKFVGVLFEVIRDWFSVCLIYVYIEFISLNEDLIILIDVISNFFVVVLMVILLLNNFLFEEDLIGFFELVFVIDKYDWFVGVEYIYINFKDVFIVVDDVWYIMVGMCFGKFILYIIYEYKELDVNDVLEYLDDVFFIISIGDVVIDVMWVMLY